MVKENNNCKTLESEQEKVDLLHEIDGKMDKMVDLLGQLVSLNKFLSNSSQVTQQIYPYSEADPGGG